jgi:hypothetical protein
MMLTMCVHLLRPVYTYLRKNACAYTSLCYPWLSYLQPKLGIWQVSLYLITFEPMYEDYICHPIAVTDFLLSAYKGKKGVTQGCVSTCALA